MLKALPAKLDNRLLQWVFPILSSEGFDWAIRGFKAIRRQLAREWHEGMHV